MGTPHKNAELDGQMKMGTLYLGNKGHYSYNVLSISLFVVVPVVCAHHITGKYDVGEYSLKECHIVHLYSETYVNTFRRPSYCHKEQYLHRNNHLVKEKE